MTVKSIDLGEMKPVKSEKINDVNLTESSLEILDEVEVSLQVKIGSSMLSVKELFSLKKGNTIKLEQFVTDPVELLFNNKTIGRGELVAAGEYFGVRITEIS